MSRFVALLRGVNVGKAKRVPMADLRELLRALGYTDVTTLLNSGNAVFEAADEPAARHAGRIRTALAARLGVEVQVVVKSAHDVAAIVAGNGLAGIAADASRLLVAFTTEAEALASMAVLAKSEWGDEAVHVGRHAAYAWCPNGILESKVGVALLRGLGDAGTTRNWTTVEKIHALLQGHG